MHYVGSEGWSTLPDLNEARETLYEMSLAHYKRKQEEEFRQRLYERRDAFNRRWNVAYQQLEAERNDFTPEAYARRRAQLEAQQAAERNQLGA